jgi:hypothetical protein
MPKTSHRSTSHKVEKTPKALANFSQRSDYAEGVGSISAQRSDYAEGVGFSPT